MLRANPDISQGSGWAGIVHRLGTNPPHFGERAIEDADYVGERYRLGGLGEHVATLGTPNASDETRSTKFTQNEVEELGRNVFDFCDGRSREWSPVNRRESYQSSNRVVRFRRNMHNSPFRQQHLPIPQALTAYGINYTNQM